MNVPAWRSRDNVHGFQTLSEWRVGMRHIVKEVKNKKKHLPAEGGGGCLFKIDSFMLTTEFLLRLFH